MAGSVTTDTDLMADGAMSVQDAEAFTTLGKSELYKRMQDGRLPFVQIGKRRLIPRRALVAMLQGGLVLPAAAKG